VACSREFLVTTRRRNPVLLLRRELDLEFREHLVLVGLGGVLRGAGEEGGPLVCFSVHWRNLWSIEGWFSEKVLWARNCSKHINWCCPWVRGDSF
jgi:hypothetical protein